MQHGELVGLVAGQGGWRSWQPFKAEWLRSHSDRSAHPLPIQEADEESRVLITVGEME